MACRKNSPGKPCCGGCHLCTEPSAEYTNLTFAIESGMHPLSFTKPLRTGEFFPSCYDVSPSPPAEQTLQLPRDLNTETCCTSRTVSLPKTSSDSSSALVVHSRRFAGEYHKHTSGTRTQTCPFTGVSHSLPWGADIDYEADVFSTMAARRVVTALALRICMVSVYGMPYTQIDCAIAFVVLRRTYYHSSSPYSYDVYQMFLGDTPDCTPYVKRCDRVNGLGDGCAEPPGGALPLGCGFDCADGCTADPVEEITISTIPYECDEIKTHEDLGADNFDCPHICRSNFKSGFITPFHRGQQRRILLPGHCSLPSELTFDVSGIVGANTDVTLGYDPPDSMVLGCPPAVALTGDTSPFTVYEADVQPWVITLT